MYDRSVAQMVERPATVWEIRVRVFPWDNGLGSSHTKNFRNGSYTASLVGALHFHGLHKCFSCHASGTAVCSSHAPILRPGTWNSRGNVVNLVDSRS